MEQTISPGGGAIIPTVQRAPDNYESILNIRRTNIIRDLNYSQANTFEYTNTCFCVNVEAFSSLTIIIRRFS